MTFSQPIVGNQGVLVREQIQSPNYVAGVSGWIIRRDGSAEFNDVFVRGDLVVGTYPAGPWAGLLIRPDQVGTNRPGLYLSSDNPAEVAEGAVRLTSGTLANDVLGTIISAPTVTAPFGIPNPPHIDLVTAPAGAPDGAGLFLDKGETPGIYANGYPIDKRPGFWRGSSAAQPIATTTTTTLTDYGVTLAPSVGIAIAAGIFTPSLAGVWEFSIEGRFAANVTGIRMLYARDLAGTDQEVGSDGTPIGTQPSCLGATWSDVFNGTTDTFRWRVLQNSGGNLNWRTQRASAKLVSQ